METLLKSSEYCGQIRKKSYRYVSGISGMAYNPFINEDIRNCYFDYAQTVLLRFSLSRTSTIRSIVSQQVKLGLVLEEKVNAPSIPKSETEWSLDCDSQMGTILMIVWEFLIPQWCPSRNADSVLRATQDLQR